jgi:molecular chaperone DnaK
MARTTIDYGIDLGTTNSSIAVLNGTEIQVIRNNANTDCTPSAVWVDKKGQLFVGATAYDRLEMDPANAFAEFKLQMGTDTTYKFPHSGRTMRPEDLSGEVLKTLKGDVGRVKGEEVQAAVITVPAAFELPQTEATKRAAQLAGLSYTLLLQEPVAAAMAYGFQSKSDKVFWLVYDFGGGTFDAAVVSIRDGVIQVVNHGGDNHLGGKLLDWEIVGELLVPAVLKERKLSDFRRGNLKWQGAFAKLKHEAEKAKIRLSNNETAPITVDFLCTDDKGEPVTFEYELQKRDVERLMEPFVLRSINICRKVLVEKRLGPANIEKILLVGGPTQAPYLRQRLTDSKDGLGIALDFSIDPMTVVARGAAVFSATQRTEAIQQPVKTGEFAIDLDYKPVGSDPEPMVGGRVSVPAGSSLSGYTIEFVNSGVRPPWRSGKTGLAPDGAFVINLWAEAGRENVYVIELRDASGSLQKAIPDRLTYKIGLVITDPPLTHAVGVALANNEMKVFIEKGTPLPARRRIVLRTAAEARAGGNGDLIVVPVVEGENLRRADRNMLIGTLKIDASQVRRDVPAGSEIEVTIDIDQSRLIRGKAYIPWLDEEFETELSNQKKNPTPDQLKADVDGEKKRLETVRMKAKVVTDGKAQETLQRIDGERMVHDVDGALGAAHDDPDAADKCGKRLLDLRQAIDDAEDALEWPNLVREAEEQIGITGEVVRQYGKSADREMATALEQEIRTTIKNPDPDLLRRKVDELSSLHFRILREQPAFWVGFLKYLEPQRSSMRDKDQADSLLNMGRKAINANDVEGLRSAVQQLLALLPAAKQEEARRGFGSTVIK